MKPIVESTAGQARGRRSGPIEIQKTRSSTRRTAGRNLAAAGLILGLAGAFTLAAAPIAPTPAQAFGLGDITGAVTGAVKKGVDVATGVAKGTIDAAGQVTKGVVDTAGRVVDTAGRTAGRAAKGAARTVDSALRNGVNVDGVNIRPACPYFVGCKIDSKGRIVIDVSKRRKTRVGVTPRRPARGVSKLPPPRRPSERVPVRKVEGITKDDLKPSCKALHCKPGHGKHNSAKRDIPRDKSIWGRPVGVKKDGRNVRVRDHRKPKRIIRDHRKPKRIIRDHRRSKRRVSRR